MSTIDTAFVIGLPLAVHRVSLGEYLESRGDEAEAVSCEAVEISARANRAAADPEWWPDLVRAVDPLSWVRASTAKALELRNGAIVRLAEELGLDAQVSRGLLELAAGTTAEGWPR
jgi:hypothetical protein